MAKTPSQHGSAASTVSAAVNNQRAATPTTQANKTNAPTTPKQAPTNAQATPKPAPTNAQATQKPASNTQPSQAPTNAQATPKQESIVVNEQEADNTQKEQEKSNDTSAPTISSNRTYLTDNDFLALSKDEQDKYLEGLGDNKVEKDHLLGLLKEKEEEKKLSDEDLAAKLGKTDIDPDSARESDEEVKAEKGDIIEWMMEKVILKGLEKTGDFLVDGAIYVTYGTAHAVYKPLRRKILDPISDWCDSKTDAFFKKLENWANKTEKNAAQEPTQTPTQPEPTNESPSTPNSGEEKEPTFKDVINELEEAKKVNSPDPKQIDAMLLLGEDLLKRNICLEDDGYKHYPDKHPYPDFGKRFSNKDIKSFLRMYQQINDARTSVFFLNSIDPEGKNNELREAAEKWMHATNAQKDFGQRYGYLKKIEVPDILKNNGLTEDILNKHLEKAQNEVILFDRAQPQIDRLNNNTTIFACNYAQYKLIEMARKPENEEQLKKLQNPKDLTALKRQFEAEGRLLMLQNYEYLRKGDKNAVSEEEMLQMSEEMSQTSKTHYKNRDTKSSSPNLVQDRLKPQQTVSEPKDLGAYADSLSVNDVISIYRNNLQILNQEEEILKGKQAENNNSRAAIEAMKKRVNSPDRKTQKEKIDSLQKQSENNKTGNINLGSFKTKEKE